MGFKDKSNITRRRFLGNISAVAAFSAIPLTVIGNNGSIIKNRNLLTLGDGKPNSKFNGVQIGVITGSLKGQNNIEKIIEACVEGNINSIELSGEGIEVELGATNNLSFPQGEGQTVEELAAIAKQNEELASFRNNPATIEKWEAVGRKFRNAGIDIHLFNWIAGATEELLDYSFKVAKVLGTKAISAEINEENCKLLGLAAERNGMLAAFHNHDQFSNMTLAEIDNWLAFSPANRLNFDCGNYFGEGYDKSTKLDPIQFIDYYSDKIFSIHLKDKTMFSNEYSCNQDHVWGQGETPLMEILAHIRDFYPNIYCDVELEYNVPEWSSQPKEVAKCVRFAREVLI